MNNAKQNKHSPKRAEHTPGPWKLGDERVIGDDIFYEIDAQDYGLIALVDATPDDDKLRANAHLIAAAPELLKSARLAVSTLKDHVQYDNSDDEPSLEAEALRAAQNAITKAEADQ